jgi:hypothetical protein
MKIPLLLTTLLLSPSDLLIPWFKVRIFVAKDHTDYVENKKIECSINCK